MNRISLFIVAFFSLNVAKSQLVKTITNENRPKTERLSLIFNPFDFKTKLGISFGPSADFKYRPLKRLQLEGYIYSGLYFNDYRFKKEGTNEFKKMGGLEFNTTAAFVWRSKARIRGEKEGKIIVARESRKTVFYETEITRYLPYDFNTSIERTIRGGIYSEQYPTTNNLIGSTGIRIGLGKHNYQYADVTIAGIQYVQYRSWGYSIDFTYGQISHLDKTALDPDGTDELPYGIIFSFERHERSNKTETYSGWRNFDLYFDFGTRPGANGFVQVRIGFPLLRLSKINLQPENATYKLRKTPERKLGRFFKGL